MLVWNILGDSMCRNVSRGFITGLSASISGRRHEHGGLPGWARLPLWRHPGGPLGSSQGRHQSCQVRSRSSSPTFYCRNTELTLVWLLLVHLGEFSCWAWWAVVSQISSFIFSTSFLFFHWMILIQLIILIFNINKLTPSSLPALTYLEFTDHRFLDKTF